MSIHGIISLKEAVIKLKRQVKKFLKSWNKANADYKSAMETETHRIGLPDPIQKLMLKNIYSTTYTQNFKPSKTKTYDFEDSNGNYIELKSGFKNGNVPFKSNQNKCFRIIFFMYDENSIEVHEIDQPDVQTINSMVSSGNTNINLSKYTKSSTLKYKQTF